VRILAAAALVTAVGACADDATAVLVHVTTPVALQSLSGRVTTSSEGGETEHDLAAVESPALPGDVRVVLPDAVADVVVQLIGLDATGRRYGAVVHARTLSHETVEVDAPLDADGGWRFTREASGTAEDLLGVSGEGSSLYAVGVGGTLLWREGGGAWSPLASGTTTALTAVGVAEGAVVAVGALGCDLLRSSDGAEPFVLVDHCAGGGSADPLLAVWADPRGAMIATGVGYSGYRSDDAGASWVPCIGGPGPELFGVWGNGASLAYAVGTLGRISESMDGGYGFSAIDPVDVGATFKAVWGSGANDLYVVGAGATVVHFDGQAWAEQDAGAVADLDGVTGHGRDVFAVGGTGTILHSSDGGVTWTAQVSGVAADLHAAWASAEGEVWVVGAAGTILRGR